MNPLKVVGLRNQPQSLLYAIIEPMNMDKCSLCKTNPHSLFCKCCSPRLALCPTCLLKHKQVPQVQELPLPDPLPSRNVNQSNGYFCSECGEKAAQFCVGCMTYLCCEDTEKHIQICADCDLYSMELAEIAQEGDRGVKKLKRGKLIEKTCQYLHSRIDTLEAERKQEVEEMYIRALQFLAAGKETACRLIEQEVLSLKQELLELEERLTQAKYAEEITPKVNLELLILQESKSTVLETLEKESWLNVRTVPAFLELLSNGWLKVERASPLMYDIGKTCPWAFQYLLLPGQFAQFCNLETMQIQSSSITNPCSPGGVFVPLSSGEYFLCGGPSINCYMIDSNYASIRLAGEMVTERLNAGAVCFHEHIYVFGGRILSMESNITQTAECFSMKEGTSVLLSNEMISPRHSLFPCVWRDKIYLLAGMIATGEVFDPVMETFSPLKMILGIYGPAIVCPGIDSLLLLTGAIYSYRPDTDCLTMVKYENVVYSSDCAPVEYKGQFYFTIRQGEELIVCSISHSAPELVRTNARISL